MEEFVDNVGECRSRLVKVVFREIFVAKRVQSVHRYSHMKLGFWVCGSERSMGVDGFFVSFYGILFQWVESIGWGVSASFPN